MTYRCLVTQSKEKSTAYILVPPKIQCFAAQTFKQHGAADPGFLKDSHSRPGYLQKFSSASGATLNH